MKKEKGFTLIELLAVIVILAIILLIATPIILNIIDDVRKGAFKSSAHGYVKSAEYKHLESGLKGLNEEKTFNYVDGKLQGEEDLDYGGEIPKNGTIHITKDGKVAIAIHNGKWCATKLFNSNEIKIENKEIEDCKLEGLPEPNPIVDGYHTIKGVNHPVLSEGMKPIIYNETTGEWDEITEDNSNWYDYSTGAKKWANARTADGSMWVWIPRYAYQIASCYHTSCSGGAGTINIKFLQRKTNTTSDETTIDITPTYSGNSQTNYINHPAFTFGEDEVLGFWVAKFEMTGSASAIESKPNVSSLRNISAADMFTYSRNMETNNRYGWGTTGVGIDTHMIKSTEWGAVAYLSQSSYGKNVEVWNNTFNGYRTGCSGSGVNAVNESTCVQYHTTNGMQASTTGNIYGVYDMSGGAWEYVAGIYGSGSNKYYNYYSGYTSSIFGDAVYETSSAVDGVYSWNGDYSYMPTSSSPWFFRGGYWSYGLDAGVFSFSYGAGGAYNHISWRVAVLVGDGL